MKASFSERGIYGRILPLPPKVGRTCGSAPFYKNERSDVFAAEPRTAKGVKRQIRLTHPGQCQDAPGIYPASARPGIDVRVISKRPPEAKGEKT